MLKKTPSLILLTFVLSACSGNVARSENATYELTNQDPKYPTHLILKQDGSFTLDFNMCEGMKIGSGSYTIEGDLYFLDVAACTDCEPEENLYSDLPTVNIELKKISDTELKVQKEVLRTGENGKKYGFCEIDDAKNVFKLIKSDETDSD